MALVQVEGRVSVALGRLFTFLFHLPRRLSSRNLYYYRFLWHHPLINQLSFEELNVSSEHGLVVFETSHRLLSPHSRGLGQQSGYWELESGNTAQEYVGLFTTLSQLKGKTLKEKSNQGSNFC